MFFESRRIFREKSILDATASNPAPDSKKWDLEKWVKNSQIRDAEKNLRATILGVWTQFCELSRVQSGENVSGDFADRLFEMTMHPTNIEDPRLKERLLKAVREWLGCFQKKYAEVSSPKKSRDEIFAEMSRWVADNSDRFIAEKMQTLFADFSDDDFLTIENAPIPAHRALSPDFFQTAIAEFFQNPEIYGENFIPKKKFLDNENFSEAARKKNEALKDWISKKDAKTRFFDERREAISTGKKILLEGGMDAFYAWIDFDGANRPRGIMVSIFIELVFNDLNHGGSVFSDEEKAKIESLKKEFEMADLQNALLTKFLEENPEYAHESIFEEQLWLLKEERRGIIEKIVKKRDEMTARREQQGKKEMRLLSMESHPMARLDPKFTAVIRKVHFDGVIFNHLSDKERELYREAESIFAQIEDLNAFQNDLVSEVMMAQSRDAGDVIAMEKFIQRRAQKYQKKFSESKNPYENLRLCPLFEGEKTTDPEFIQKVLLDLWHFYVEEENGGRELFERRIVEIFFAGSDLSKAMGSASSILAVQTAAVEILKFNAYHGANIAIKLGSGEPPFRQGGYLDNRAFDPILRGRIVDLDEKEIRREYPEEKAEKIIEAAKLAQNFYREKFGEDWRDVLQKKPSGFFNILTHFAAINSITLQSRGREMMMKMTPAQLLKLIHAISEQRFRNREKRDDLKEQFREICEKTSDRKTAYAEMDKLIAENITPNPAFVAFCAAEKEKYQEIIGDETDATKNIKSLGALIETFAKSPGGVLLRDRALARGGADDDPAEFLATLARAGINVRCIGANAHSRQIFPLALLGKGAGYEAILNRFSAEEVPAALSALPVESFLEEVRRYSEIAPDVFKIMRKTGFRKLADALEKEFSKVLKLSARLANILLDQNLPSKVVRFSDEIPNLNAFIQRKKEEGFSEVSWAERDGKTKLTRDDFLEMARDELGEREVPLSLAEKDRMKSDLSRRFRGILDFSVNENGEIKWNFTTRNVAADRDSFRKNAKNPLKKVLKKIDQAEKYLRKATLAALNDLEKSGKRGKKRKKSKSVEKRIQNLLENGVKISEIQNKIAENLRKTLPDNFEIYPKNIGDFLRAIGITAKMADGLG